MGKYNLPWENYQRKLEMLRSHMERDHYGKPLPTYHETRRHEPTFPHHTKLLELYNNWLSKTEPNNFDNNKREVLQIPYSKLQEIIQDNVARELEPPNSDKPELTNVESHMKLEPQLIDGSTHIIPELNGRTDITSKPWSEQIENRNDNRSDVKPSIIEKPLQNTEIYLKQEISPSQDGIVHDPLDTSFEFLGKDIDPAISPFAEKESDKLERRKIY